MEYYYQVLWVVCVVLLMLAGSKFLYRCVYVHAPWTLLQRHGLNGPTPLPFFGNNFEIASVGMTKFHMKHYQKYGSIFGYYIGVQPMIFVADPETIKEITVREFDSFMDRPTKMSPKLLKYQVGGLFLVCGEEWKRARRILSPTFSPAKMKTMVPLVKRSVNTLIDVIGAKANLDESIEIFRVFSSFTMETMLAAAFGRIVNIQMGEADELTNAAALIFRHSKNMMPGGLVSVLLTSFPPFAWILPYIVRFSDVHNQWKVLYVTALSLVQARRKEKTHHKDLLQLLLDASGQDSDDTSDNVKQDTPTNCSAHQTCSSEKKLTDEQIVNFAGEFLLIGYETTANTLAYTSYLLALNPEVQEKLQKEIDEYFEKKPTANAYEAIQDMTYLDNVIQESLRMFPTATVTARYCLKTTTINGVSFPEGSSVMLPIHVLHSEPKYWQDPDKFKPDRFKEKSQVKHPQLTYIPFGFGPRNCIGMRFALLETKMALIELLKMYSFVRAPDTEVPLQTTMGITMSPQNGVFLRITSRN